jgi:DmsE family decaheme c-type cytochrome
MRVRFGLLPASVAILLMGVAMPASSQEDYKLKPGARGKLCLDCHVTFEETMQLPSVHTPVKAGNCSDCHNPHASTHGQLLDDEPDRICASCHSDMAPEGAMSIHEPVLAGRCVDCHDPHAAQNPNTLKLADNELCNSCHADIASEVASVEFKHSPVERNCLGCHDAHASAGSPHLLKKEGAALCTGCHKPDREFFVRQHVNYPVAESNCTSCHNPHGSNSKGIMWASVHRPITARMCKQCHEEASSPDALNVKKEGVELCRGCHSEVANEIISRNRIHWPAVDQVACLNCHGPHATAEPQLLRASTKSLCASCHADTLEQFESSLVKHPPVDEGECSSCHEPHASNNLFLMTEDDLGVMCGTCHDYKEHSSHPLGEQVIDPRNRNLSVDCLSCHRAHASPFTSFGHFDTAADLCVQCHRDQKR